MYKMIVDVVCRVGTYTYICVLFLLLSPRDEMPSIPQHNVQTTCIRRALKDKNLIDRVTLIGMSVSRKRRRRSGSYCCNVSAVEKV